MSTASIEAELVRRHRAAAMLVGGVFALIVILVGVALGIARTALTAPDRSLVFALWMAMVAFALGAIVLRRTRLSARRLQIIADLKGATGLLGSLQRTTLYIVLICSAIVLMGFAITVMTGDAGEMSELWRAGVVRGGIIAAILLVGCYPRRAAWRRVVEQLASATETSSTT